MITYASQQIIFNVMPNTKENDTNTDPLLLPPKKIHIPLVKCNDTNHEVG